MNGHVNVLAVCVWIDPLKRRQVHFDGWYLQPLESIFSSYLVPRLWNGSVSITLVESLSSLEVNISWFEIKMTNKSTSLNEQ